MPKTINTYAGAVAGAGALTLIVAIASLGTADFSKLAAYLALACAASTLKVRLPGLTGTFSPGFVALLAAGVDMSWTETAVVAAVSALVQCLWRAQVIPTKLQIAFNVGNMVLASGAAVLTAHTLIPADSAQATLARVAVIALVQFGVNSSLVSVVLSFLQNKNVLLVWRECHLWTFVHYLLGALVALALLAAGAAAGLSAAWLGLPVVYMQHMHYREFIRRAACLVK